MFLPPLIDLRDVLVDIPRKQMRQTNAMSTLVFRKAKAKFRLGEQNSRISMHIPSNNAFEMLPVF
jgi:hypothetical protein